MREVIDEIEAVRKAVLDSVLTLSQADLDFTPSADRWSVGEILHHLRRMEESAALMKALEHCARFDLMQVNFPHPVLGKLDGYQWALYVGKHEERHRRQIEKVKAMRVERS